jgi:RNA polymerase sigma-70 factor (ECF subfamily)
VVVPRGSPTDAELVRLARSGNRRALDRLLRRHHGRVAAICRRLCRDPADAEDAAQEALLAIVNGLARFDGRSSFATWAYRVAANRSLDELRRRRRRPEPVDPGAAAQVRGPDARDPGELAVAATERDRVLVELGRLPEEFRDAVVLRDVLDLDYHEIAVLTGVPIGTVRSRIARGRGRLADALGDVGLTGAADGWNGSRTRDVHDRDPDPAERT